MATIQASAFPNSAFVTPQGIPNYPKGYHGILKQN